MISGNNTTGSARVYRRVDSLVKTGVPAFLLATPLRAYTLTHSKMGKFWTFGKCRARDAIAITIAIAREMSSGATFLTQMHKDIGAT